MYHQPIPGGLKFKRKIAYKLVFSKLAEKLGGKIRFMISGGAPLSAEIAEFFGAAGLYILEGYGLTETSPAISLNQVEKFRFGTVGQVIPNVEVKIAEDGEILSRGDHIMMGYYNKPDETRDSLIEGWFLTGDLGKFDEDGYLTIVDRKKDMIIAGGYNIYPVELDGILMDHPKILEACTIGIPHDYRGETVKAYIVVKKDEVLTEEEVIGYCKKNLAAYKVPKIIEFIDELPKSAVGKILRRKLRDIEMAKIEKAN